MLEFSSELFRFSFDKSRQLSPMSCKSPPCKCSEYSFDAIVPRPPPRSEAVFCRKSDAKSKNKGIEKGGGETHKKTPVSALHQKAYAMRKDGSGWKCKESDVYS